MEELIKLKPRGAIKSFHDLEVFQLTYQASVIIFTQIIPKLPKREQYDLSDQLGRSCKAVPRLIAEGFAKKHQDKGFRKYLDDSLAESNETIVSLAHCRDIYSNLIDRELCDYLIKVYDRASRQLYTLAKKWEDFHRQK